MNNKPFKEWTFQELVAWATGKVSAGITEGKPLHECMQAVCIMANQWKPSKEKK